MVRTCRSPRCENPNTRRAYATVIDKLTAQLDPARQLADVDAREIANALEMPWSDAAPSTWNRKHAVVGPWLAGCHTVKRWPAPALPADCERRAEHRPTPTTCPNERSIGSSPAKTSRYAGNALWRMLYETAARASEILALDVEQLDLATAERPSAPGAAAASIAARPLSSSAWITSSESSVARCAALAGWCSLAIRCTVFQELLVLALSTGRCQITVGWTLTACDGWLTTVLASLDDL